MKRSVAIVVAGLMLALPVGMTPFGAAYAQDGACVGPREAQQAVESGRVLELPDAARRAGLERKFIGEQARLCDVDGSPHWVVSVMTESGASERVVLNAEAN